MLSQAENDMLVNTDRGRPMGELFRRFWLPVALSQELPEPDCTPVRLKILGEEVVAFRDTAGRVGLLDAYCAHRSAPLFFGRNEEHGLRCIYHGWKYDVEGRCIDLPNAPEGEAFKAKVTLLSYPCEEAGDLIWAYLGPPERQPPFPEFEWLRLPRSHRYLMKFQLQCNYMQSLEGDLDPSHGAFLHMNLADLAREDQTPVARRSNANTAGAGRWLTDPSLRGVLEDTDSGVICLTAEQQEDGTTFATAGPIWQMPIFCNGGIAGTAIHSGNFRVPIDNSSLMYFRLRWSYEPLPASEVEEYERGGQYYPALIPGTLTPRDNISNDYNIDRMQQRYSTFSGIRSFPAQDAAAVENQRGPVADRTREHLTSADGMIIHVRSRLLNAARLLTDGVEPEAPWHPEAYGHHFESAEAAEPGKAVWLAKQNAMRRREAEPQC
jgi:phenylpropionate dioxygenase-like ring-hydroxylating dioxygenase large terminal subunit